MHLSVVASGPHQLLFFRHTSCRSGAVGGVELSLQLAREAGVVFHKFLAPVLLFLLASRRQLLCMSDVFLFRPLIMMLWSAFLFEVLQLQR